MLVTSSNAEWWAHVPTGQQVTVTKASIKLPYLACLRNKAIEGRSSIFLDDYKEFAPFTVDEQTIKEATRANFPIPGALAKCKPKKPTCKRKPKLRFTIDQPFHARIVQVDAYVNGKHVQRKRGHRVRVFVLKRPKGLTNFTVKIVAKGSNGQKTISVRKYRRCSKTSPNTHVVPPPR